MKGGGYERREIDKHTMMKPAIRIDQPKPSLGLANIFEIAIGKITPPKEEPAMAIPT